MSHINFRDHNMDQLLNSATAMVCNKHGWRYEELSIFHRKLISHYLCEKCGLQPLYYLDVEAQNMPRCSFCGFVIQLGRTKFTKLRKEILISLKASTGEFVTYSIDGKKKASQAEGIYS